VQSVIQEGRRRVAQPLAQAALELLK
jgi:hypothetical protein